MKNSLKLMALSCVILSSSCFGMEQLPLPVPGVAGRAQEDINWEEIRAHVRIVYEQFEATCNIIMDRADLNIEAKRAAMQEEQDASYNDFLAYLRNQSPAAALRQDLIHRVATRMGQIMNSRLRVAAHPGGPGAFERRLFE